jgi:cytochrome c oxidase assembly protein subunit 15
MLRFLTILTWLWAFVVIVLGAWVRLSDAGLGCPDWPACYGHWDTASIAPEKAVEYGVIFDQQKAFKEMFHRYFAGGLGVAILFQAIAMAFRAPKHRGLPVGWAWMAVLIVVGQAALGALTVTLKLNPMIVLAHLLGGFLTFAILGLVAARMNHWFSRDRLSPQMILPSSLNIFFWICAWVCLWGQIALGGWLSANYAALACPDFPTCLNSWWPALDLNQAFRPDIDFDVNHEFGRLDHSARVTIHWLHRMGALFVFCIIFFLSWHSLRRWGATLSQKGHAAWILFLLGLQVILGITNVLAKLPLWVAVGHNATAALLMMTILLFLFRFKSIQSPEGLIES